MSNPKHTNWIFTLNNYSEEDPQRILDTIEDNVKYVLFGKEVAPTTGTPHLQGLIVFRSKVRRRTVQETIKPGVLMHVEIMRSLKGSIVYNRKDGDWFEAGERPVSQEEKGMKEKERYKRAWDLARSGDLDGLIEEHPDIAMRHYSTIKRIRTDAMHKRCSYCGRCGSTQQDMDVPSVEDLDGYLPFQRGGEDIEHWYNTPEESYSDFELQNGGYLGGPEGIGAYQASFQSDALPFPWECADSPPRTPRKPERSRRVERPRLERQLAFSEHDLFCDENLF